MSEYSEPKPNPADEANAPRHPFPRDLVVEDPVELLKYVIRELDHRIHNHYDWNADPDKMTALVGDALRIRSNAAGEPRAAGE